MKIERMGIMERIASFVYFCGIVFALMNVYNIKVKKVKNFKQMDRKDDEDGSS